ncbi:sugar ABC transporter ATP-binding protein [Azospirillum sp. SYSU D00513]|uniref:sugar ABC transporter ATP-binding protein n=1 Tax=Azospirillum sp. SYSU D00513 TaxID=2812561 RepID=UPI001A97B8AC|nr:sugar ABC transporter ATP-binding protein [Azospirillum sp. SYSU D00513]
MSQPVLGAEGVAKSFGPVQVLFGVDFDVRPGEVHALMGENGAGKSTLMKILGGYQPPTAGTIRVNGQPVQFSGSGDAEALGIVLIHQEFNLAETMTVEENISLGREVRRGLFLDKKAMRERARAALAELNCPVDPNARVSGLAVSERQMVEIAKAVSRDVRVLIMDEPTAVLTGAETEVLFRLIRRLTAQGVGVVYISHKLDEVKAISDRVTVLRDGRHIATRPAAELSQDDIAQLMVGRDLSDMFPPKRELAPDAPVVLEVEGLTVPGWVENASFRLRRGEILGFAGLVGAGRSELIEGMLSLRHRTAGTIRRDGKPVRIRNVGDAAAHGIAYLTEDRKGKGLLVGKGLRPNLTLLALDRYGRFFIDERKEATVLERAVEEFDIRVKSMDALVGSLSGGNQQKLLLAKTMQVEPSILIVDEPTRGIDIGTKRQIYLFLHDLARRGASIIVISSEMPEIIGLSHRVVVMRSGVVTGTLSGDAIEEAEIVRYATGLKGGTKGVSNDAIVHA